MSHQKFELWMILAALGAYSHREQAVGVRR